MTNFVDDKTTPRLFIDQDAEHPLVLTHIDVGHGGSIRGIYQTKGKQWDFGDFKILEGVQNRAIGKLLAQKFMNNHVSYNFTTISNYDESLTKRIEYLGHVVKAYPNHKHVLLSIHADATEAESNANGVSFYTTPFITDSDFAANFYFPHLYDLNLKVRVNRAKAGEYDHEANFFIIRKAEAMGCVAMLYEFGFMTNREEALKIMQPEFQATAANALYKGTRDLINKIKTDGTIR